jgi:hypothetical protein
MAQPLNGASSRHPYLDIARGMYTDWTTVHLFGFNRDVATSYETVWNNGGGIYSFPASAVQMSVVSDSTSDTMDVQITGLDGNYNPISEVIELNGTGAVTTSKSFLRINDTRIMSGNNVGDITIANGGTTYAFLEATYGIHQAAIYSVPAGHSFYITRVDFTSGTITGNKYGLARACLRQFEGPELHFFETSFVTSQLSYDLQVPFKIPEKCDFSLECKSSSSTNEMTVFIAGVLLDD